MAFNPSTKAPAALTIHAGLQLQRVTISADLSASTRHPVIVFLERTWPRRSWRQDTPAPGQSPDEAKNESRIVITEIGIGILNTANALADIDG